MVRINFIKDIPHLSLVFSIIKITLKRFLEEFLVRLSKNPSRNRFNVILIGKKTRLVSKKSLCITVCRKISPNFKFLEIFQTIIKLFWNKLSCDWLVEKSDSNKTCSDTRVLFTLSMHRSAFCPFPFRWIYYCHSSKSIVKETGKMHFCAMYDFVGLYYLNACVIGGWALLEKMRWLIMKLNVLNSPKNWNSFWLFRTLCTAAAVNSGPSTRPFSMFFFFAS